MRVESAILLVEERGNGALESIARLRKEIIVRGIIEREPGDMNAGLFRGGGKAVGHCIGSDVIMPPRAEKDRHADPADILQRWKMMLEHEADGEDRIMRPRHVDHAG